MLLFLPKCCQTCCINQTVDVGQTKGNKMKYELKFKTVNGEQRAYYRSAADGKWYQVSLDTAMMVLKEHYPTLFATVGA